LSVVIESLSSGNMAANEVIAWCTAMLASDRNGFIARKHLEALCQRVQTTTVR
jgi:hypothetical protein